MRGSEERSKLSQHIYLPPIKMLSVGRGRRAPRGLAGRGGPGGAWPPPGSLRPEARAVSGRGVGGEASRMRAGAPRSRAEAGPGPRAG